MLSEPVIHSIDLILKKVERLIAWEREILGLEARKTAHHDLVNLPELAERIANSYGEAAKRKAVKVIVNIAPDALVVGDSGALHEMIRQLIVSALQGAPHGGRVTVCGAVSDGIVELCFSTNGLEPRRPDQHSLLQTAALAPGEPCKQVKRVLASHGGRMKMCGSLLTGTQLLVRLPVSD